MKSTQIRKKQKHLVDENVSDQVDAGPTIPIYVSGGVVSGVVSVS